MGDDENLLCTLLDWADDLNEVRFQLRYKEQDFAHQLGNVTGTVKVWQKFFQDSIKVTFGEKVEFNISNSNHTV